MPVHTGGCQCGAIRYRAEGDLTDSSICHCRMCQKAFGAYYAPLVSVRHVNFTYTRGEPKRFQSSNYVKRGFCADCGTPLTYEAPDGVAISAGSFDNPSLLPPTIQYCIEGLIPFTDELHNLPHSDAEEELSTTPFLNEIISFQHPDHDTDQWDAKG
jgi:hypothetical protein